MSASGVLLIHKPQGPTSHDIVNKIRRIYHTKSVGHTGTLDPMATGLLVLCVGRGTKLVPYLSGADKVYEAVAQKGLETDTEDITGTVTANSDEKGWIEEKDLAPFLGRIQQLPPMYSAKKIKGKKLYEYAREGIEVERKPHWITIHSLSLTHQGEGEFSLKIHCSSGTYIRTLIKDIAHTAGTMATMTQLIRTQVGPFSLEDALSLEELEAMSPGELEGALIPMEEALDYEKIHLPEKFRKYVENGRPVPIPTEEKHYRVYVGEDFYGIGQGSGPQNLLTMKKLLKTNHSE
ncbi:MAG: tRNA pseudouridine(55) synthase TruB [Tissierellia bacterium]|nr:tRNA pseudouridine(55) synthase TruB [Tissierellia bacterium]